MKLILLKVPAHQAATAPGASRPLVNQPLGPAEKVFPSAYGRQHPPSHYLPQGHVWWKKIQLKALARFRTWEDLNVREIMT